MALMAEMIVSRHHLLLTRILPLVAIGMGVLALIPSDFRAAEKTMRQAAPVAPAQARVQVSVPKPTLIATAKPVIQPQNVQVAGLTTAPGAEVLPTDAPSDGVGTVLPDGLRDGRVGGSDVNVRSDASTSSPVLFTLSAGTTLRLGEDRDGWVHVYSDTQSGWLYSGLLADGDGLKAVVKKPEPKSRPLSGAVRLRGATAVYDRPGGSRIYVLDGGERVSIAQSGGGWARIITDTDESGWIRI